MDQQIKDLKMLCKYKNGNYFVELYEDGTKVRYTDDDNFISSFANNVDMKLTNKCSLECKFCHEDSTKNGKHGRTDYEFLNNLPPMEIALGGGNILEYEEIVPFLEKLKRQGVFTNITINQYHFMKDDGLIDEMVSRGLIYGLGISYNGYSDEFLEKIKKYPNVVLHVINGIISMNQLESLYGNDLKILILGYKHLRRGEDFYSPLVEKRQKLLYDNIHSVLRNFKIVSFDNLGIDQLNVKRFMLKDQWESFYQGDDGDQTFYIDLEKGEFARSSTSLIRYPIMSDIKEMFKVIQKEIHNKK